MLCAQVLCYSCSLEIRLLHILNKKQVVCLGCGSDVDKHNLPFNDVVCLGQVRACEGGGNNVSKKPGINLWQWREKLLHCLFLCPLVHLRPDKVKQKASNRKPLLTPNDAHWELGSEIHSIICSDSETRCS